MNTQQPYDISMKSLLKEDAAEIIPRLLPGATLLEALDIEVVRTPMRADRVYRIHYRGQPHILEVEFQASADERMALRLLVYHADLLYDYNLPVISLVVYLFKTTVVEPPFKEMSGSEELLSFKYRNVSLWTLDARQYLDEHVRSMYVLLPAMRNANANLILQAIEELLEYYRDNESQLARRLLWLSIFLRRAEALPPADKQRVQERINMFDELFEQDEFVRKQRALGREEGKMEDSRELLTEIVQARFPSLADLAKQKAQRITKLAEIHELIRTISTVSDEKIAWHVLSSPPAA
ncbi:MAG: hypothetical protein JO202_06790 [Ktedonobacteraceae bacterium]|nr:hypothetical protein [Ktedonobacteraceae bacterium]